MLSSFLLSVLLIKFGFDANDLGDVANANISTAAQSSFATTSLLPDPSRHGIAFSICCHVI